LHDATYRESSVRGLAKANEARSWSDEAILEAIRAFSRQQGRVPKQAEFRSGNGLPGYGTVWRRFGSTKVAVAFALDKDFSIGADRTSPSPSSALSGLSVTPVA
jgi:hypothetical protein